MRNLGYAVPRPTQKLSALPRLAIQRADEFETAAVFDLREALDRVRRRDGLWELLCVHRSLTHGHLIIRLVGDNGQPHLGVLLEINGETHGFARMVDGHPTRRCANRHGAFLRLLEQVPDCQGREWQWSFVSFPSWKESRT